MGIVEGSYLAYAALAATAAGTAISYSAAQDQKDDAQDMAKQQQAIAAQDASFAASEADLQARAIRKAADRQRAEARASLANAGVTVGEGTAEQIDAQIATDAEQDALMAMYDGSNRARQISVAGNLESQRSRGAARAAGYAGASALASGAYTASSGWKTKAKG